ncbi:MerR family transcriptional regulator [Corynebacterium xerosis]|jgi:DNA-binding transcriptional MerR regulator|nr:MerR family transcriptional regulator [Corynebacterium xerosis]AYJ32283.1 MerR family transcriptional regulator [Corynebacterium xerosis]NMF08042.1 MerR family transcriptional regulator [Corynebacterium xerosis]SQB96362.1 zinc-responsive transcriptional regulator [Clostridium paraputrificum]
MSIGAVLSELQQEFPDVTVSKIRFLESEGLISPSRSQSGYRRFARADVDRLRYILTVQRDNYLPLKVIKEQLDNIDAGNVAAAGEGLATVTPLVTPDQFREAAVVYLTRAELAERAGIDEEFVGSLVRARLLSPDAMDGFDGDDLAVATTAGKLREFGLDARHMKTVRTAAAREADLVGQAAAPMARSKGDGARQKAEEMAREMTALLVTLHGTLVKRQVNDDLNR